jgi:hypothetical protein
MQSKQSALSRRRTLQLIALGISGTAASELLARDAVKITPKLLHTTAGMVDTDFTSKQLDSFAPALQANMDQFANVRELEIDDLIEPALNFSAGWR